ncbi:MAG: single-stranded-DNA-specific exonuclease RecJ, partial [Hyphomicrobiaceae bacterium]
MRPREGNSPDAQAFLGVTSSARGFTWRERLSPGAANMATAISQQHGLPELLGRVLAARGITLDEVPNVLEPTIRALMPDPSTLNDMDKAARRLADAIVRRERVAVFGDYDVDGACSAALMRRFLLAHGLDAAMYIPDRMFEGYGPNVRAIQGLVENGAQLIITVDCGTTSFEALAPQHRGRTDVLVIDHHQADEQLPEVNAVVNPNRQDDLSGLGHLCAAGVVFMLLVATTRELRQRGVYENAGPPPDLLSLLDLVALATVCDVVPLQTLNRAYVTRGLEVMRQRQNVGLRALVDAAGLNQPPTPYLLGFVLGPRINAGGRIGDAALGARLLSLDDETEAARIAVQLDRLNRERKAIETQMLEEAAAEADRLIDEMPDLPLLVVASDRWHKGVVGLVASRLVERFGRPACVIAWEEGGLGTGSLRSISGVDIGSAVRAAAAKG